MPTFCVLITVQLYGFNEQKTADSILQADRWRMVIFPYTMIDTQVGDGGMDADSSRLRPH